MSNPISDLARFLSRFGRPDLAAAVRRKAQNRGGGHLAAGLGLDPARDLGGRCGGAGGDPVDGRMVASDPDGEVRG